MRLTIIIAAIIIAIGIMLSNGIYVLGHCLYLNKFTGTCFYASGEKVTPSPSFWAPRNLLKDKK
jgi:hypothetical protein